ncbi:MAG: sigma-70 family RNA polymerase sigma factor [Acidobacteria bacterium]|nr:sigma-70 family RNA polymerase sigma factor [Acidobacteriota bacterium]MCZ6725861.1 sigma-70 family RNA polymerase sigma factor [Acidobacteriota bacterium]
MPSENPTPTDAELVAGTLSGREDYFGDLVNRYKGPLVNYLFRMVRQPDEAHDLAQEVFIKIYRALDRYDPQYKFSTWLFRIAQNAAIDRIRKRRIQVVSMDRPNDDGGDGVWEFPSDEPDPYRDSRNRERGDAIQQAIDALPWEYRELIVMRHYGELSYEEIARAKDMPLGTVKNKLFRGRQMLKKSLAQYLTD